MKKIIIEVEGGVVQQIYSTEGKEQVKIYVIDWDMIDNGGDFLSLEYTPETIPEDRFKGVLEIAEEAIRVNNGLE